MELGVVYEWKPTTCEVCKAMGHEAVNGRNPTRKRIWVQKKIQIIQQPQQKHQHGVDHNGLTLVKIMLRAQFVDITVARNPFQELGSIEIEQVQLVDNACDKNGETHNEMPSTHTIGGEHPLYNMDKVLA